MIKKYLHLTSTETVAVEFPKAFAALHWYVSASVRFTGVIWRIEPTENCEVEFPLNQVNVIIGLPSAVHVAVIDWPSFIDIALGLIAMDKGASKN